jgi:hypothetical protein
MNIFSNDSDAFKKNALSKNDLTKLHVTKKRGKRFGKKRPIQKFIFSKLEWRDQDL